MAIRELDMWRKASKSCQKILIANGKKVTAAAELIMLKAAEDFLQSAEARPKTLVPYYTGNLMDSIGVRLLNAGTLVGYRTMTETTEQHAIKPQRMAGVKGDIWGEVELMQRILRPSRRTRRGLVGQMMVGVPYADNVGGDEDENGNWTNTYFSDLSDLFVRKMETYLKAIEKYPNMKAVGDVPRYGIF